MITSNHVPLICGVLFGEQRGLAAVPDDHEQSGTVAVARDQIPWDRYFVDPR